MYISVTEIEIEIEKKWTSLLLEMLGILETQIKPSL